MERQVQYPSFGIEHFGPAAAAAAKAVELARAAAPGADPLLAKELLYAEAAAARFPPGSERQPARNAAERHYATLMRDAGARSSPGGCAGWVPSLEQSAIAVPRLVRMLAVLQSGGRYSTEGCMGATARCRLQSAALLWEGACLTAGRL